MKRSVYLMGLLILPMVFLGAGCISKKEQAQVEKKALSITNTAVGAVSDVARNAVEQAQDEAARKANEVIKQGVGTAVNGALQEAKDTIQGSADGSKDTTQSSAPSGEKKTSDAATKKEFDVIAKKWEFSPSTLNVKQGDVVTLNIKSVDVDHGFSLPSLGVNSFLTAGETKSVTFVADKKGNHAFACSVFCGSGHSGMTGMLIVE